MRCDDARRAVPVPEQNSWITQALLAGLAMIGVVGLVGILAKSHGRTQIPVSTPWVVRTVRFADLADGGVAVSDGSTGADIATVRGEQGFLRPLMHGLAIERVRAHRDKTAPFRLTRWADGRLTLDDPQTGRHVELEAFGPTNAGVFAAFLPILVWNH